jgi:hypothetical protein
MAIACVALFMATTGTGVAVIKALPKGSVGTDQLKNKAVNSNKVKDHSLKQADFAAGSVGMDQLKSNAVNSSKVKDHTLMAADFVDGQLPAGASSVVKRTAKGAFGTNFSKVTASCNTGEVATGGGADWDASTSTGWPVVSYSVPDPYNTATPTGWAVEIDNISGSGGVQAISWVFCAKS